MLKRVLIVGLAVGVGIAALYVSTAQAGRWIFILPPGMWWNTGSLEGCANIGRVPNPLQNPAALSCEVTIIDYDARCVNPERKNVLPGEAANKYFEVSEPIDPGDISDKEKGVAEEVCVVVKDEYLGIKCKLRNWHPQVLVTRFQSECATKQCLGTGDDPCETLGGEEDTQICRCSLPLDPDGKPYSLDNPPGAGIAYDCDELEWFDGELIETGEKCELSQ